MPMARFHTKERLTRLFLDMDEKPHLGQPAETAAASLEVLPPGPSPFAKLVAWGAGNVNER